LVLKRIMICLWFARGNFRRGGRKEENPTLFQIHSPNKQNALNKSASQWAVKRCSMLSMTLPPLLPPPLIKWWIYEYEPTTHAQRKWGKANFNYAFLFSSRLLEKPSFGHCLPGFRPPFHPTHATHFPTALQSFFDAVMRENRRNMRNIWFVYGTSGQHFRFSFRNAPFPRRYFDLDLQNPEA